MSGRRRTLRRTRPTSLVAAGAFVAICGLGLGPVAVPAAAVPDTGTAASAEASAEAAAEAVAPAAVTSPEAAAPAADEDTAAPSPEIRDEYRAAVADYLHETVAGAWQDDAVAVAPEAVQLWDARQRDMIDPRIAALEDDGWTVRIAVLPAIMFPYAMDSGTGETMAGLQRGLGRIAEEDPHPQTVYVLAQGSTAHFSVYADGRLESELTQTHATGPPYVNSEVTAAGVSYTLRAVAADPHEPELLEEETSAVGWTGVRYRALSMEQGDTGSLIMTAAFLAGGVVGLVLLVLALLVLLPRRSGPLARIFGTRIDLVHETSALVSLRERATHSRRKLTRAKRLSSSQETALGRLPAPDETYSPLVWAGWNALADELEGDGRGHCFFRPDLPADDEESTEILGALTVVPVSGLSAERIEKGRAPSYLSRSGIDRGKPYWTRASSPWAASGYGAFGSLSEAIAAMPADWEPARGAARVERAVESARTASPSSRAGASPWARTALLGIAAIAALVAGIVGGLHDADQMEKVYSAELGAPGSLVADPAAAQEQVIAELVADSADGPAVTPLSRAGLVGVGLADIGDAADSVADELGREVRVIGLDSATTGVVDSADTEDLIADALPDGALAVVLDYRSAELVAAGIRDDYRGGSPERPQFDADATVTDEALGQLRWASQVSWIPDDGVSGGLSDSDDEDEAEFMPAPDTAEWENRTWVRTLMGAIGAALAVIVVGVLCRGLVVDRTDPTAKAKKRSGSGTRKRAAGGSGRTSGKQKRSRR